MSEKDLLKQLKSLKSVKLDAETKESNKRILMTQISNTLLSSDKTKSSTSFSFYFKNILLLTSKPVMILSGLFVFVLTSILLSSGLYKDSKPTDSLYIARIISEKAKLNTTFSQEARERLASEFANRHASDIASVLMDLEIDKEENKVVVEKLTASFKTEISKVKNVALVEKKEKGEKEEDESVFSASSLKEEDGIDIHIEEEEEEKEREEEEGIEVEEEKKEEVPNKIEEIEKLFEDGKYSEVILMLGDIK